MFLNTKKVNIDFIIDNDISIKANIALDLAIELHLIVCIFPPETKNHVSSLYYEKRSSSSLEKTQKKNIYRHQGFHLVIWIADVN